MGHNRTCEHDLCELPELHLWCAYNIDPTTLFYTLKLRLLNVATFIIIKNVEDILDFFGGLWGEATQLEEPFVAEGFRGWKHKTKCSSKAQPQTRKH